MKYKLFTRLLGIWEYDNQLLDVSSETNNIKTLHNVSNLNMNHDNLKMVNFGSEKFTIDIDESITKLRSFTPPDEALNDETKQQLHQNTFMSFSTSPILSHVKVKLMRFSHYKYFFNLLYIAMILVIISWRPIYKIANIREYPHYIANFFIFVIPIQYFIFFTYFRTLHFYQTILCVDTHNNPSGVKSNRKMKMIKTQRYSSLILLTSLICSMITLVMYSIGYEVHIYSQLTMHSPMYIRVFMGLLCFVEHFLSCCIFLGNVSTFSIVFTIRRNSIQRLMNSMDAIHTQDKFFNFFENYNFNRDLYNDSIEKLNAMFSTTTILGLMSSYGYIRHIPIVDAIDVTNMIYVSIFLVAESIYMFNIYSSLLMIKRIKTKIISGEISQKCLQRKLFSQKKDRTCTINSRNNACELGEIGRLDGTYGPDKLDTEDTNDADTDGLVVEALNHMSSRLDNQTSLLDWILVKNSVQNIEWKNFTLLGFAIERGNIVNRICVLVGIYIIAFLHKDYFDMHLI
jgi:hypothetical protein